MAYDIETPSAAQLWPYRPDLSSPFEIRRAFRTDIITSRSNKEQRRALRDVARVSARYSTVLTGDDLQAAKHHLRAAQNAPVAVPDHSRYVASTGGSSFGGSSLTIGSPPAWVAPGQILILCDGMVEEMVIVDTVADPTVNLTDTLSNAWPAGSIVRPALFGLLSGRMRAQRLTRGAHRLDVSVQVYPSAEPVEDEGSASVTFNGYDVLLAEADFSSTPGLDYIWPVEQVDYGIGRTAQFRPVEIAQQVIEAEFNGLSASAAAEIEGQFLRSKGMRGAFYRPSGEKDMMLAADVSASTQMNVVGTALANDFGSVDYGAIDVAVEICKTDGTRLHRLITGIAVNGGNSRITLSSAITTTVATTARISWMPLVRFASDELVTQWRGANAGSIRAGFQSVEG